MSTELAPQVQTAEVMAPTQYLPALSPDDLGEMAENLKGFGRVEFPIIRGIKDGFFLFSEGSEPLQSFVGTILDSKPTNIYFENKYKPGSKELPRCFSPDGVVPVVENPIHPTCAGCPKNEYELDPSTGKKTGSKQCKNTRPIFVLAEGAVMPRVLRAPPTSLRLVKAYVTDVLADGHISPNNVKTRFSLFKLKPEQAYWNIKLTTVGRLTNEQKKTVQDLKKLWKPMMAEVAIIDVDEDLNEEPKNEAPKEESGRDF